MIFGFIWIIIKIGKRVKGENLKIGGYLFLNCIVKFY